MTSITRNFPWFIRTPAVNIIGEKCYISLVENLNVNDIECIKYALSKGLGLGIVLGSSIMKVPQIQLILSTGSSRGLSLPSFVLETLGYAITLAYSYRNNFPFSTYGENFALTIQNAFILVLIVFYPPSRPGSGILRTPPSKTIPTLTMIASIIISAILLYSSPQDTLHLLQALTLPLSLFSKVPQIIQNHKARSTGNLSAFAVACQTVGCLARLFTSRMEVDDGGLLFAAFGLALVLNCVVAAQMFMYWGKTATDTKHAVIVENGMLTGEKEKKQYPLSEGVDVRVGQQQKVEVIVPPQSPVHHRPSGSQGAGVSKSPPPTGRKWSRKID